MKNKVQRLLYSYRPCQTFWWRHFAWFGIGFVIITGFAVFFVRVPVALAGPTYIFNLANGGNTINGISPTLFRGGPGECMTQAAVKQVSYNWNAAQGVYLLPSEEPGTDQFTITITSTKGNTSTATLADAEGNNCLTNPAGGDIGVPSLTITIQDNGLKPNGGGGGKLTAVYTFVSDNEIEATKFQCALTNGVKNETADFTYDNDGTLYAYTWHPVGVTYNGQITDIVLKSKNANGTTTYTAQLSDSCNPAETAITITARAGSNITPKQTIPPPPGSTSVTTTPPVTCNAGLNPLNWAICAIVNGMVDISNSLDNLINNLLSVGTGSNATCNGTPTEIFGGTSPGCGITANTSAAYKTAWGSFRDIALGLLVVACLVVIVSTALGFELLDAYTIRKMLPRIIIVAIAITLSWDLMDFFVQLTNDLGYGIRYLIYKPFEGLKLTLNIGGGGGVAVTLIGGAAITALGIFGLLLFAMSAALSLFTAFLVMILRQILITILIIVAPVAIVCYILPNTQRIYSLWWNLFARALLMFPLIAAVIAAGRVFAAVAFQNPNPISQIIAFGAYFGVYLAVPKMWSYGGAAVSAAGNMVNQAASGGQRSLAKKRSEVVSTNIKKARAGQRWDENFGRFRNPFTGNQTSIGHLANRAAVNAFDQDELARYRAGKHGVPGFKNYYLKTKDQLDDMAISSSIEDFQDIEKHGGLHYRAYQALTGRGMGDYKGQVLDEHGNDTGTSVRDALSMAGFQNEDGTWKAPKSRDDLLKVGDILQHSSDDKERLGGHDLQENAGFLATLKSRPGHEYSNMQAIGMLGLAAEGRAEPEMLAATVNDMERAGQGGVAQRMLKQSQKVGVGKRPDIAQGKGIVVNPVTGQYESVFNDKMMDTNRNSKNFGKEITNPNYDPLNSSAVDAVLSYKSNDWSAAKAETIDSTQKTIMALATYRPENDTSNRSGAQKQLLAEQGRQMRGLVKYQTGEYGPMEANARAKWQAMRDDLVQNHHMDLPDFHARPDEVERPPSP
jgi:hypothetical protein